MPPASMPSSAAATSPLARNSQELVRGWRFVVGNALGFALFAAAGLGWVWLLMWLLPMATWLPLATRIRTLGAFEVDGEFNADVYQATLTAQGLTPQQAETQACVMMREKYMSLPPEESPSL